MNFPHSVLVRILFPLVILLSMEITSVVCLHLLQTAGFRYQFISDLYPDEETKRIVLKRIEDDDLNTGHISMDSELGWTLRPRGLGDQLQKKGLYHVNDQGFRGTGSVALEPADGITRIMALGDSFTFGSEVRDADAWPALLATTLPQVEVLNSGVPGYGNDQAFLLSQRLVSKFHPQIVLLGFQPENANRNVNVFRAFYSNDHYLPFTKPRFLLKDGVLELIQNPLQTTEEYRKVYADPRTYFPVLGKQDEFYGRHLSDRSLLDRSATVRLLRLALLKLVFPKPPIVSDNLFSSKAEAVQVTIAIMDAWYDGLSAQGVAPVILILPNHVMLEEYHKSGWLMHQVFLDHWKGRGMRVLDLTHPFGDDSRGILGLYLAGHYSPAGTNLVAGRVADYLRSQGLVSH